MTRIWNWVRNNPNRAMFLVPILLVAGISISHVVTWYDMANPINWAIYLSIAIEIGAMTALIAATNKIKGGVWFMFGLVTLIQLMGNIFYSYKEIDATGDLFQSWVELTGPVFEMMGTDRTDIISMKRWLAMLEGGFLPIISLTALHFFVKYEKTEELVGTEPPTEIKGFNPNPEPTISVQPNNEPVGPLVDLNEYYESMVEETTVDHSLIEEENPEDEIIVDPEKVIKTEPRMVREDFPKPTKVDDTPGEKLNRTWQNIVKNRRSTNDD